MSGAALIYARVSTDEQAASGLGLEAQLAACSTWAQSAGLPIRGTYRDTVSGTAPISGRPGLEALLASARRGDTLVAARRDRLARDPLIAAHIKAACQRKRLTIVTLEIGRLDDSPAAELLAGVLDLQSAYDRKTIAARTKAALGALRARGERGPGALPYGYRCNGRLLERDPLEGPWVDWILARRLERPPHGKRGALSHLTGLSTIVAELTAAGAPCRGARWHKTSVRRILHYHGAQ